LDFATELCSEEWVVDHGGVSANGSPEEYFKGEACVQEEQGQMVDGAVNTIKIEKAKKTAVTCSEKMQLGEAKAAAAARMSLTLAKTNIHFNRLNLKKYKGNLTKFVEICPEAKGYYELTTPLACPSQGKVSTTCKVRSRRRPRSR